MGSKSNNQASNELNCEPNDEFLVEIDPEIADIVPGFLENKKQEVILLTDALERNDLELLQRLGHSMKGSGGGYGFPRISEIGEALETHAARQNLAELSLAIASLHEYLQKVKIKKSE